MKLQHGRLCCRSTQMGSVEKIHAQNKKICFAAQRKNGAVRRTIAIGSLSATLASAPCRVDKFCQLRNCKPLRGKHPSDLSSIDNTRSLDMPQINARKRDGSIQAGFNVLLFTMIVAGCGSQDSGPSNAIILSESEPPPAAFQDIGMVGCSMTNNAIIGYELLGGTLFWPHISDYGGGVISAWAADLSDMNDYWMTFNNALNAHPDTDTIWLQLCTAKSVSSQDTYENARVIIDEILRRAPQVELYISAQPTYSNGVCSIAGDGGPERMQDIVNQVVAEQLAKAGPILGPLRMDQTLDTCHVNRAGGEVLGTQLADFFGM